MRSHEIRSAFRDYFAARGHEVLPSASLVPDALDQSVLLTTAGMQPFKPFFLGQRTPPASRVTSTQKCFRTTDIDEVGKTARHLTFFEMMGNFSFGDYFKEGAVAFAWELSTGGWGIDPSRIWITVFAGDEQVGVDQEAIDLWLGQGVPAERIRHLGRKDNFWAAGPTGPCGPCSELYYDRGPEHGCGKPVAPGACGPGCDCDRFLEYWNLVFMQYDRSEDGALTPLPAPSIDTGSGVERVSALLQGVHSVYETDGFQEIIRAAESWSGARYDAGGLETRALRVLADHGRSMTFLTSDGVVPGNEGRDYVLRRVIRRAVSLGSRIGLEGPFLQRLQDVVVESFGDVYPELVRNREQVAQVLVAEEERFSRTLATGSAMLDEVVARAREAGASAIPSEDAFRLHDTYGFPFELTAEIAAEHGLGVDEAGFEAQMDAQRRRARAAAASRGGVDGERVAAFARSAGAQARFVGYDALASETEVIAAEDVGDGRFLVKLAASPFYAESGGQVSDAGTIEGDGFAGTVEEAFKLDADQALLVRATRGAPAAGLAVRAVVDGARRRPTVANHSATHLLQKSLQKVLGDHVRQRGSAVRPDKLRFDFSHDRPLSPDELARVEAMVNEQVVAAHPVRIYETTQDEARKTGAMMLFGEKYGEIVRVVDMGGWSVELCGGTHVGNTAEVGPFTITSESSVGQGVRRIEAITAGAALAVLREREHAAVAAARALKTQPERLAEAVERLQAQVRELEKRLREGGGTAAAGDLDALLAGAEALGGVQVLAADAGETPPGELPDLADRLRGKLGASAVALASRAGGKAHLLVAATPEAVAAGVDAGKAIAAMAPHVGGGGGGRAGMARAGGADPGGIAAALDAARATLRGQLGA